jgi:hypothetical protein
MNILMTRRVLAGVLLCCLASSFMTLGAGAVQQPGKEEFPEEPKKLNELIEKSINWYDVLPDSDAMTPLTPVPVMRWRNVVRGQAGEAMMVVWPHKGRPVAMASIFPWKENLYHEFDSLSRGTGLIAKDKDRPIWSPEVPGVEFKAVPKAPRPAKTGPERLRQMKSIAEGFKATMTGWAADDSDREALRLLPRPLYRYDLTNTRNPDPKLLDGALFAHVLGTDPEVVLVLEAIGTAENAEWQFACVRATSGGLEVRWGDDLVWTAAKHGNARNPKMPHFAIGKVIEKQ